MNTVVSIIACVVALNVCWQPDYNHVTVTNRNVFIQGYCNENDKPLYKKKFKVDQINDHRYFKLEQDTVYIDYDIPPAFSEPLSDFFSKKVSIKPNEISSRHHLYEICFVIDKNGQIKERGFLKGDGDGVYRKQLAEIMNNLDQAIVPGKINGQHVAVLYSFELDLSSNDFK